MKKQKISVIIPVYNVEQYLRECLDSVINQSLRDIEIICVEDCSTDNSLQILEEYKSKDNRIKIVQHSKNKGLGPARNTGIDAATADYIFFLDSDDYIEQDSLRKLYEKALDTKSDIIFSEATAFTTENNKSLIKRANNFNKDLYQKTFNNYIVSEFNFKEALNELSCTAWGKLFLTTFIKDNNLRFINQNIIHEDNNFFIKYLSCFPDISAISDLSIHYRIRANAITTTGINKNKRERKQKSFNGMKTVIADAFQYISERNNIVIFEKLCSELKNSKHYIKYYDKHFGPLTFRWGKDNKMLKIFFLELFREKPAENGIKIFKFFGIKIKKQYKRNKNIYNQQEKVQKYLIQHYINPYFQGKLTKFKLKPKKNFGTDKIIWQYWGQGINNETPQIVKICFSSINKFYPDYKHIILNNDNISEYIDLPDFIYKKFTTKKIGYAHFSDVLRLCLLAEYGGMWVDATILMSNRLDAEILKQDFFTYQRNKKPLNCTIYENFNRNYFSWDRKCKVFWLNSFILSKNNYPLIVVLRDLMLNYMNKENKVKHYFLIHLFFDYLVNNTEYSKYNCTKIGDIAPHILQLHLYHKYNEELFNNILEISSIHKLTYLKNYQKSNNVKTIWDHICAINNTDFDEQIKNSNKNNTKTKKILVHLHLYYQEQLDYFLNKLKNITDCYWDLYITVIEENDINTKKILEFKPNAKIIRVENRGYDVWPFIFILNTTNLQEYDYVLKLHTKGFQTKNMWNQGTQYKWRNNLVDALIGTKQQFKKNLSSLQKNKKIGMIGTQKCYTQCHMNSTLLEDTYMFDACCQQLGIPIERGHFIAGTMFLCRANLLQIIKNLKLDEKFFDKSQHTTDSSTYAHVFERLFGIIIEHQGYFINKYNFFENIFSAKNNGIRKEIRILGIKFKFKSKKLIEAKRWYDINNSMIYIKQKLLEQEEVMKEIQKKLK